MISESLRKIIPYLVGIIILLYIMKPSLSFKPSGQLREYGFGYDSNGYKKTLYTMQNITILITVILYVYIQKLNNY
jgi:hypothetical protein